jgi:hypothetical protein
MPIGMYIILTGMFFIWWHSLIVLHHHRKNQKMMNAELSTKQFSLKDYPVDLIEGCRRGDQKSQLKIYKLYYRSVYAICLKVSDNPSTAESLMHESFLEAFENIRFYTGDTSFGIWILKFIKSDLKYEN